MTNRTQEDYYLESKRIRSEVLQLAEQLKGHPLRFIITNGITMRVEITKNDLKTIVSKNVSDNKFNAIKVCAEWRTEMCTNHMLLSMSTHLTTIKSS